MKVLTEELDRHDLTYMVAKCEGMQVTLAQREGSGRYVVKARPTDSHDLDATCQWEFSGPIIEREGICLKTDGKGWIANIEGSPKEYFNYFPLVAAMQCYVASKMGDEVDVPDEFFWREVQV